MSRFSRLFGKRQQQPEASPITEPRAAEQPPALAPEPAMPLAVAPPPPALTPPEPPVAPPLKSLDSFRRDPAFKNFMAKARRAPGAVGRPRSRPGGNEPPFGQG